MDDRESLGGGQGFGRCVRGYLGRERCQWIFWMGFVDYFGDRRGGRGEAVEWSSGKVDEVGRWPP